jgi:AcrR family transcriptional regulator
MTRHYEDNETRRRQVAEAALEVIAEEGVTHFTTRSAAERVGISDGTLFRHFGNKREIILEAMSLLEVEIDAGLASSGEALADLEAFFRHRAAFVGAERSVGRLIFSDEWAHLAGDVGRERVLAWRQRSVAFLRQRVAELQESGELRSDLDAAAVSMLVQGALLCFAMQASLHQGGSEEELARRIDHAWRTLRTVLLNP